ncbi:MAG: NAD(P)H-dependent oxidoreductase [Methyloligellaceae bacterium]
MPKKITIINGHPDRDASRYCHALSQSYMEGALEAGHEVKQINISELQFPLITSPADYKKGDAPDEIKQAQNSIEWAEHIVIIYPLWLGTMPALLKGFLEQIARPGFAFQDIKGGFPKGRLQGRSARVIVTMGMPGFIYKWFFFAHSLKALERNILKFIGISPVRSTILGSVEAAKDPTRKGWIYKIRQLGIKAR